MTALLMRITAEQQPLAQAAIRRILLRMAAHLFGRFKTGPQIAT
jgi:hypothetical protein